MFALLLPGLGLLATFLVANETYPKPPSVLTGEIVCEDFHFVNEQCGPERVLSDEDVGSPGWVDWFQRHDWTVGLGLVLVLSSLVAWPKEHVVSPPRPWIDT
jgi:hypothetical protein